MPEVISKDIHENLKYIKETLKGSSDLVIREFEIGDVHRVKLAAIYIENLASRGFVSDFVVRSLFVGDGLKRFSVDEPEIPIVDLIQQRGLDASDISEEDEWDTILVSILSGNTAILIDGSEKAIMLETKEFPGRSVDEPATETLIRGPREGFVESIMKNIALVRRRVREPELNIEMYRIGQRSQTSISLMYIKDIANPNLVDEVKRRLNDIDIDAIPDSATLEFLIEDSYISPFPQIENTERPDSVSASLYEGRVAIIVDNSPFALLIPATIGTLLNSSEDYYSRWTDASAKRILRMASIFLILFPSALYVAITTFHPGILPTQISYYLAASRINVPFPALLEALMMEFTIDLLRESATRLSGPIGTTIGIVGGLVIGQAAVSAGIVSPLMIIIVAISSIATFSIPSHELSTALRLSKFMIILFAGILGLFGIMLGVVIVGTHILSLNSFGVPFSSPYSGLGIEEGDLKDTLIKVPVINLPLRPGFTFPIKVRRMRMRRRNGK
ncbi:MAG TPA: spore germination protein [Anaerovoracaceae bacterium]|nr:spore germination protein [Anaerovoracaceae bacterium]